MTDAWLQSIFVTVATQLSNDVQSGQNLRLTLAALAAPIVFFLGLIAGQQR